MKLNKRTSLLLATHAGVSLCLAFASGCGGGSSTSNAGTGTCTAGSTQTSISTSQLLNGSSVSMTAAANVLPLTVGSSLSGGINEPSVTVKICDASSHCATISHILLDTGSYGLRVFNSVLIAAAPSISLTQLTGQTTGQPLAECVTYADNSADWGPVVEANVTLGTESSVSVPIQLIESTYGNPSVCSGTLDSSPTSNSTGFNGILGVGLFAQDCGDGCVYNVHSNPDAASNGQYFACSGSNCQGDAAALASQVVNPVNAETTDNNGVILKLPTLASGATSSLQGYVVLGIGTESNNSPSGVTMFPANDNYGTFDINCNGQDYPESYIDSGSNAIFFSNAAANLPEDSSGWYAPASTINMDVLVTGSGVSTETYVPLTIVNFDSAVGGSNFVYSQIAGDIGVSGTFDLGLPFFFGRNTYVGLENKSSSIGSGTYWAF